MKTYSVSEAIKEVDVSRSTFYRYLKELGIKPKKDKNVSFFTEEELEQIKQKKAESHSVTDNETVSDNVRQHETIQEIRTTYEKQLEGLEQKLERAQEDNKQLTLQVGQWQGRARTLEEQNVKLLESQSVIEQVPEQAKKSWWQFWKDD